MQVCPSWSSIAPQADCTLPLKGCCWENPEWSPEEAQKAEVASPTGTYIWTSPSLCSQNPSPWQQLGCTLHPAGQSSEPVDWKHLSVSWIFRHCVARNKVFVTHRVMEDRDLNKESNDNLKAENHGHLNINISSKKQSVKERWRLQILNWS